MAWIAAWALVGLSKLTKPAQCKKRPQTCGISTNLIWLPMVFKTIRKLTEAFALVGGPVYEDLGADDVPEGQEHLHQLRVAKLLREVVDEEVAALGSRDGAPCKESRRSSSDKIRTSTLLSLSTFSLSLSLSFMQALSRECSLHLSLSVLPPVPCDDSSRDKERHDTL